MTQIPDTLSAAAKEGIELIRQHNRCYCVTLSSDLTREVKRELDAAGLIDYPYNTTHGEQVQIIGEQVREDNDD